MVQGCGLKHHRVEGCKGLGPRDSNYGSGAWILKASHLSQLYPEALESRRGFIGFGI